MGRRRSSGSGRPPEPRPHRCWCTRNAGPLVGLCGDDLLANRDPCHRALQLFSNVGAGGRNRDVELRTSGPARRPNHVLNKVNTDAFKPDTGKFGCPCLAG
jgi:hypothetical protein